jgi:hypothetical protein
MEFKRDFDATDNGANSNSVIPYKPQLDQPLQLVKRKMFGRYEICKSHWNGQNKTTMTNKSLIHSLRFRNDSHQCGFPKPRYGFKQETQHCDLRMGEGEEPVGVEPKGVTTRPLHEG